MTISGISRVIATSSSKNNLHQISKRNACYKSSHLLVNSICLIPQAVQTGDLGHHPHGIPMICLLDPCCIHGTLVS